MTLLLLALQADAPAAAADAIRKTRAEKSFESDFEGAGGHAGTRIGKKGSGQRCSPGLLLLYVETEGGKKTRAVRVGDRAWVYSNLDQIWLAHDNTDEAGIAHGMLNPDNLLGLLAEHAPLAKAKGEDLELRIEGAKGVELANRLVPNQDWTQASATVLLRRDGKGRVSSIGIDAAVRNAQGPADLTVTFRLSRFGELTAPDRIAKVALDKTIRDAIAEQLK